MTSALKAFRIAANAANVFAMIGADHFLSRFCLLTIALQVCGFSSVPAQVASQVKSGQGLTLADVVTSTLTNHPLLHLQEQQVKISRGLRLQATGAFDTVIGSGISQSRVNTPLTRLQQQGITSGPTSDVVVSNVTTYSLRLDKQFRNGTLARSIVDLNRSTDNVTLATGVNTSNLAVLVTVPLLRGRGYSVVAASEHAASIEVDATLLDLSQTSAQLVSNSASSYWNLVAAYKNLAIAVDAEERGKTYVENVQAFISADRVPRSDIHEVTANLADRSASRAAAQQMVASAREQLALDIGLPAEQMTDLPDPVTDLPDGETQPVPSNTPASLHFYLDEAMRRRADFLAAQRRIAEASTLVVAAKNQLHPQVNLNFSTGYSGMREGRRVGQFFSAATSNVQGLDATVGLNYSFPPSNHAAEGQVLQSMAAKRQAELRTAEIIRTISATMMVSLEGVRNAIVRVKNARAAVESFRSALNGEREKYRLGLGSVVSILTVEDKLNNALLNQVQARLDYALSLTQFRFSTGTLIEPGKPVQNIDPALFFTMPFGALPEGIQ